MRHWSLQNITTRREHLSEKTADLKPVYLILSEQSMLVEQALTRLRKRVEEVANLDFNFEALDAESAEEAASRPGADRTDLATGCSGFPWSVLTPQ